MERLGFLFQLFREDSVAGNVVAHLPRLLEPLNLLDVAALCAFLYILLSQLARSPLRRLLNGLLFLLVLFSVVTAFEGLTALNLIIRNSYLVVLVSIPIIFQSEIRNMLSQAGRGVGFWDRIRQAGSQGQLDEQWMQEVAESVRYLHRNRLGALIVLTGRDLLANTASDGIRLDAVLSRQLLNSVFEKQSSLHDGAVIIAQGRIQRANVLFSIGDQAGRTLSARAETGTRHLAAQNITAHNDALCLVVSEETGGIAYSIGGHLTETSPENVLSVLYELGALRFLRERGIRPGPAPAVEPQP
ncbi:MAG: diadenylate cyclase [Caldilineaceae bacterium]|nr:diadenylate cyclase [Caldilineaceae bacterium]